MRFEIGERPRFSIPGRPRTLARAESRAFSEHLLDRYMCEHNSTYRSLAEDYCLNPSTIEDRIKRARKTRLAMIARAVGDKAEEARLASEIWASAKAEAQAQRGAS